jgi:hypothetical protein
MKDQSIWQVLTFLLHMTNPLRKEKPFLHCPARFLPLHRPKTVKAVVKSEKGVSVTG